MKKQDFVFTRRHYLLAGLGLVLMIIGYLLMAGGGSDDPTVFNPEIFSPRRIVWGPMLIILGILTEIFAIMYRPREDQSRTEQD
ncbi:MAG: DUF3098 domain-containing protein [Schleiferiaceae bacterium]|jgi:hypothetical protein|nr:DUF3098 domain-containing protein [Schleiferiaceae bacterium]MDR9441312.1 DUF3098 domain-containing protein [Schleiferiaceae bacterium]